jgi:hypothetical protein
MTRLPPLDWIFSTYSAVSYYVRESKGDLSRLASNIASGWPGINPADVLLFIGGIDNLNIPEAQLKSLIWKITGGLIVPKKYDIDGYELCRLHKLNCDDHKFLRFAVSYLAGDKSGSIGEVSFYSKSFYAYMKDIFLECRTIYRINVELPLRAIIFESNDSIRGSRASGPGNGKQTPPFLFWRKCSDGRSFVTNGSVDRYNINVLRNHICLHYSNTVPIMEQESGNHCSGSIHRQGN